MMKSIPKIIHYCWFGKNEMPSREKKCIISWQKKLSDYEFRLWNEETFDINSSKWTKMAYELKKYAFVSDYVRLWALKQYGGIYLDTDVKILKSFNDLLSNNMFVCFEDVEGTVIASCVIGAVKEHCVIKKMLTYYNKTFDISFVENNIANVVMLTEVLMNFGLIRNGKAQSLKEVTVYPRTYFCPMDYFGNWNISNNTYCIHYFSGSWLSDKEAKIHKRRSTLLFKVLKKIYDKIKVIKIIKIIRLKITKL